MHTPPKHLPPNRKREFLAAWPGTRRVVYWITGTKRRGEVDYGTPAYFERQQFSSNQEFWRRFGTRPDFAGMRVLDLGCGLGAMSSDVAEAGGSVLGVDTDAASIEFARRHVKNANAEFLCVALEDLGPVDEFDVVLSKDTFEHVEDVPSMLTAIYRALKPGGALWAGFSPLYYSPFGDHQRVGLRLPWAHALLPEQLVLSVAERRSGHAVKCLGDIGLNGMTPREFQRYIADAGFEVTSIKFNQGDKPLMKTLNQLRRFRRLERFATVSIYAVLRRPTERSLA